MSNPRTQIHERVESARAGRHHAVIGRTESGWAVMGDQQVTCGYCLLLPDPVVPDLNTLSGEHRVQFLADMTAIGDALLAVTQASRINYEILGNLEPALHAHIIPRYADEPAELRTKPIWFYDWPAAAPFDETTHGELRAALRASLSESGALRDA